MSTVHELLGRIYRVGRNAIWRSPIGEWPVTANLLIRLGFVFRRWFRIAPQEQAIGIVNGHQMMFDAGSEAYFDMTHGAWEPGVTRLFEQMLRPGMVVVDAGAHIGYFTLLAARLVGPTGKVYAFEPVPSSFALLQKNVELNGYTNVTLRQMAVSDGGERTMTFYVHANPVGSSFYAETLGKSDDAIEVGVTSLDSFFEREAWPNVDLIKMDIEGAEPEAVAGMAQLAERNPRLRFVVEYIPHILERTGHDPEGFLKMIRELGFRIDVMDDKRDPQPLTEKNAKKRSLHAELLCSRVPTQTL
ncbi:MAG: FkbM family methyltransferase [Chloroflexi bacterium]|nr:FkbM family methyltransferase [Chloroflexota bacterium]